MGSRRQPVLYYDQLRAAGQKPIVPRRHWRCRARRHEIQSREIHLALPPVSAYAGPSARNHRVPSEPGMATTVKNWKKFVAGKHGVDWQRDFFDHRLRDHHELEEKTSYILMNPVRKALCQRAEDWMWVYRPNDRPPPTW
jgi:hypothetical protein